MPPKKKPADAAATAETTSRATRSSTRVKNKEEKTPAAPKRKAPAKKKATAADDADNDDDDDIEEPPAKKAKTKAPAKPKRGKKVTANQHDEQLQVNTFEDHAGPSKPVLATPTPAPEPTKKQATIKAEPYSAERAASIYYDYADQDQSDVIGPEGFEKICVDADIPMEGSLPILLSWQLNAKEMGKLDKSGWLAWTAAKKVSSLPVLKLALSELNSLIVEGQPPIKKPSKKMDGVYDRTEYWQFAENPKNAFQKLYAFSFALVKPPQSRNIEMDTAKAFWAVLLAPKYSLMNEVLEFITGKEETYKAVNKDLWGMMLEFCETMNPNLEGYEADGAWPTLLDEFVAHKKGKTE